MSASASLSRFKLLRAPARSLERIHIGLLDGHCFGRVLHAIQEISSAVITLSQLFISSCRTEDRAQLPF